MSGRHKSAILPALWTLLIAQRGTAARTHTPEAFIACQLFDVFLPMALMKMSPVPTLTRNGWVQSLSNVAVCFETSLTRQIDSSDSVLARQIQADLAKRAAAMCEPSGGVALGANPDGAFNLKAAVSKANKRGGVPGCGLSAGVSRS